MKQKTLKGSFSLFGKGLHTGLNLTVTFNPAPENTGYKIQRIDLEGQPIIDAIAENVIDTQRGTVLAKGDGEQLIGSPAVNPKMYFKARAIDAKLPEMYRQIAALQREIDALKEKLKD